MQLACRRSFGVREEQGEQVEPGVVKCLRDGCPKPARGDEFCSTICAKIHHDTVFDDKSRYKRDKERHEREAGYVFVANPNVNRPAHEGPHVRQQRRFTTGRS